MSETKWTPGPWRYEAGPAYTGKYHLVISETGGVCEDHFNDDSTAEANAHLISAAPELYEALKDILNDLEQGAIPNSGDMWWDQACASLAKARGETK